MLDKYISNLESISCNICGSDDYHLLANKERRGLPLKTVICKNCGLIYINPRPTKELYDEFYKSDYRKDVSGTDEGIDKIFDAQVRFCNDKIIDLCQKNIDDSQVKNILDIGCSYGGILKGLKEKYTDAQLFGIEPVIKNAEFAKEKTGANVATGLFEDYSSDNKFDIIIISRTLNHSLDPKNNLLKVRDLLSDNGIFILIQHDFISELCRKPFESVTQMTHPFNFYRESIQYFLESVGLNIVDYRDNTIDNPSKNEMKKIKFTSMDVVSKKGIIKNNLFKPNWEVILQRIKNNEKCRDEMGYIYRKWRKPNIYMKVYRKFMKLIGKW